MALVGEVVARFKAETADYIAKVDQAKEKNRQLAQQMIATAGSAEKAMATLTVARRSGEDLGTFGLDKRQISGLLTSIRQVQRESQKAAEEAAQKVEQATATGALDRFKSIFGEERGMRAIIKGGAAGMIGEVLAGATDKMVALKGQLDDGTISAGQFVDKLLQGLPLFGGFYRAALDIRELITGENAELQRQINLTDQLLDAEKKIHDLRVEEAQARADNAKDIASARATAHRKDLEAAGMDFSATEFGIRTRAQEDIDAEKKKLDDQIKAAQDHSNALLNAVDPKTKKTLLQAQAEAKKALDAARAKLALTPETHRVSAGEGGVSVPVHNEEFDEAKHNVRLAQAQLDRANSDVNLARSGLLTKDEQAKKLADFTAATLSSRDSDLKKLLGGETGIEKDTKAKIASTIKALADKLKATPIYDWVKKQLDDGRKEMDRLRDKAQQIRDQLRSPVEVLKGQLDDAVKMRAAGVLSSGDLSKYFGKTRSDLLKERADILRGEHDVYRLPDIAELRAGQTLYAPPTTIDQDKLQRLTEIRDELRAIKDKSQTEGLTIEEINL